MALINKTSYVKSSVVPGLPAFPTDPVKSSLKSYNTLNVSPLMRTMSRDTSKPRMSGMIAPIHNASTPPQFPKKDLQQNQEHGNFKNDDEKISSDHISVVFYATLDEGPALEFFMRRTDLGYAFFETPTPGPLDPWRVPLDKYLKRLFLPTSLVQGLLRLDRWAVPGMERMVSHAVCSVKVARDHRDNVLDHLEGGLWLKLPEIIDLHHEKKLLSSDVMDTLQRFQIQQNSTPLSMGIELSFAESFLGLDPSKAKKSGLELLIEAAKLGRNEQEVLYTEFLKLSVPFLTLGLKGFTKFMKLLGWSEEECKHLFRTFDMQSKEGLSYRDFLCGIAATEPVIQHGGPPAEIRCRYIFKFYDRDGDGRLSFNEFKSLVRDIRRSRNLPETAEALQADAEKQAKLFGESASDSLGLTEFLTCVGQLRFRGTSHLLRSSSSVIKLVQTKDTLSGSKSKRLETKRSRTSTDFVSLNPIEEESAIGGFTQSAVTDEDTYEIASHSVRVRKSGTVLDVHSIWDIEHSGIFGKKPSLTKSTAFGSSAVRIKSVFNFNQNAQAKEMLNGLKYFENKTQLTKDPTNANSFKPPFSWGEVDRNALGACLISICGLVKDILLNEPRLVELSSPVYILGDIHGNFPDLLAFEKTLWRLGPVLTPASFLFLGDYVDRGEFGVEVISYLFSHKLTAPSKFTLLRGNHEIREVQKMFTFYNECVAKFGDVLGQKIWDAINDVFDVMPLAAVIDKKIFCAHGGIPAPWMGNGLAGIIKTIENPLPKPEEKSKLAWELMWGDPMHKENLTAEEKAQLSLKEGFGNNQRRGTAHVFTEEALDAFLKRNNFSHVVRAHEVQQAGFHVQFGGKLLTVFSSSKYCGGSNEAACILADKMKLRTIRLDTS